MTSTGRSNKMDAQRFHSGWAAELSFLNKYLIESLENYPYRTPVLLDAAKYAVAAPGHRWRPLLCLRMGRSLGVGDAAMFPGAAAIEFLHTASIILDDLPEMDDATLRRGQLPTHKKYGAAVTIFTSHWLCQIAHHLIHGTPALCSPNDIEDRLRLVENGMMKGQVDDLENAGSDVPSILRRYQLKSGILYGFSASVPALIVGMPELAADLDEFGNILGTAYQISDDIHDCVDSEMILGKDIRKDVGKNTIPSLCGLQESYRLKEEFMAKALSKLFRLPGSHDEIIAMAESICR